MIMKVPLNPTKNDDFTDTGLGIIGIMKTGGVIFNHLSNPEGVDDVASV